MFNNREAIRYRIFLYWGQYVMKTSFFPQTFYYNSGKA